MTTLWCLIVFIAATALLCAGQRRKTACGPSDDLRVPLTECQASQWIRVSAERYSAYTNGSTCAISNDCRHYLSSHTSGLQVSCNGPVGDTGACWEETLARDRLKDCGSGSDFAAVEVRYDCIPGWDVVDLCSNVSQTWTPVFDGSRLQAYLATPDFPNTPALSQHCTCRVTGENLWIQGYDIQLDVGSNPPWSDMLTVNTSGSVTWSTGQQTGRLTFVQEPMAAPDTSTGQTLTEAIVSYRDYNQPGQRVWLMIHGVGDSLNITCEAEDVPPPPTTTTTTTTTTTPTTTTTTTTTTTPTTTTKRATAAPVAVTPTTRRSPVGGGGGGDGGGGGARPPTTTTTRGGLSGQQTAQNGNGDDDGVMVGLSILAVILVAVALVLGIIIWRRYQLAKKEGQLRQGEGGRQGAFLALQYWYRRYRNRQHHHGNQEPPHAHIPISDFDGVSGLGLDDRPAGTDHDRDAHLYETVGEMEMEMDLALRQAPSAAHNPGRGGETTEGHVYDNNARGGENISRSPGGGEGERGLSSKKEKFVAKVLDETLESIVNQREALTGTGLHHTLPAGHTQPAAHTHTQLSAHTHTHTQPAAHTHTQPTTHTHKTRHGVDSGSDGDKSSNSADDQSKRRHTRSSHLHHELADGAEKAENNPANECDVYATPNKRPPVPDSGNNAKEPDVYATPNKRPPVPDSGDDHAKEPDIYATPNKRPPVPDYGNNAKEPDVYATPNKRPRVPDSESSHTGKPDVYATPNKRPPLSDSGDDHANTPDVYALPNKRPSVSDAGHERKKGNPGNSPDDTVMTNDVESSV